MHISINNSFPSTNLHIGNPEDDETRIGMFVDTGAPINTGILKCYLWTMS